MSKNGRYVFGWDEWAGETDGHIVNVICKDGKKYIVDDQDGLGVWRELSDYLYGLNYDKTVQVLRVDKLLFDVNVSDILVKL